MSKIRAIALAGLGILTSRIGQAQQPTETTFSVDGRVALHSFMALSDAHLEQLADLLHFFAATDAARSGDWQRIRGPLGQVHAMSVPAVLWYARPNGNYWTVQQDGRVAGSLSDRAYFPRVLRGQTILGDLVVSHSTNRNTAIVAVPVRGRNNAVVGVLGASVHLDSLGTLILKEMGGLEERLIFFAIDSTPIGALNSDPNLIFTEPMKLGDETMRAAFTGMLARTEGTAVYNFRGHQRTVLFHRSAVTGWWYALGVVEQGPEVTGGSR